MNRSFPSGEPTFKNLVVSRGFDSNKQAIDLVMHLFPRLVREFGHRGTKPLKKPLAIVLDIDGTSLYNHRASDKCHCSVNVRALYQLALASGVRVFFVTARPDTPSNRQITSRELASCGYSQHSGLYMDPSTFTAISSSAVKAKTRARIAKTNKIILNVGDAHGDIVEMPDRHTRSPVALSPVQRIVAQLKPNKAYLVILPRHTPVVNLKLKNEK